MFPNLSAHKEIVCIVVIVSYSQFLITSFHLYNNVLQIQTISVVLKEQRQSYYILKNPIQIFQIRRL